MVAGEERLPSVWIRLQSLRCRITQPPCRLQTLCKRQLLGHRQPPTSHGLNCALVDGVAGGGVRVHQLSLGFDKVTATRVMLAAHLGIAEHRGDQGGPTSLMAGPESATVISMEILIE